MPSARAAAIPPGRKVHGTGGMLHMRMRCQVYAWRQAAMSYSGYLLQEQWIQLAFPVLPFGQGTLVN